MKLLSKHLLFGLIALFLALERALSNPDDEPVRSSGSRKWRGPEQGAITEEPEPLTPSARQFPQNSHRRETAEIDDDDD